MTPTQQLAKQPKKLTQYQTIKNHLIAGKTISTWEAYENYHITSLAQHVHKLRTAGTNIDSKLVTISGKTFSVYWIEAKITHDAQSTLNQYLTEGVGNNAK